MPPFARSRKKPHVVRKRLADGTIKEYRYVRRAPVAKLAPDTVGALVMAYRQSPEWLGLAEVTRRTYAVYLKEMAAWNEQPVASVNRRGLLDLRDAIAQSRGVGASTGFLRTASTLFGWAVDRQWIVHSPASRLKALPGGTLTAWTWDQATHAMTALPEPYRRVVVLAAYLGQRRGDLAAMPWSAYDGSAFRFTQQKTGVRLVVPAHPVLQAELAVWRKDTPGERILVTDRGLPWQPQHLSHMLPQVLVKIGLPPLGVHGLRKLAAARLADMGASTHEIQAITGHKTLGMVQLYTASVSQEALAQKAIDRLPKL